MMKKISLLWMMLFALQLTNGQMMNVNGVDSFFNLDKDVSSESDLSSTTINKKYLTKDFKPAQIDGATKMFTLRFNIFENQMEYSNNEGVYYMKKGVGSKVHFTNLGRTFECFNISDKPTFLEVYDRNNSNSTLRLISKQSVRFIPAEKSFGGYAADKPAKYIRKKDEHFFYTNNEFTKVPKSKRGFYEFFGSYSSEVKAFMKKEGLGRKDLEDLLKIIEFFNGLETKKS